MPHSAELYAPDSPRILALDLGRSCGWALLEDGHILSGTKEFRPGRHTGAGMEFVQFRSWLSDFHADSLQDHRLDRIYYEEVHRHLGTHAAHVYGAFWGTLTAWCQTHEVPFEGVPVATIKRHATGKGNANKEAMVRAAVVHGWSSKAASLTDDEADALALLDYARAILKGESLAQETGAPWQRQTGK